MDKVELGKGYKTEIIIPKIEDYTQPGFLFTRLTSDFDILLMRDIGFFEDHFVELEKAIIEEKGDEGRNILYAIGKNSGYTYAKFSRMTTRQETSSEKSFSDYVEKLMLFIIGTYSGGGSYDYSINPFQFNFYFDDFIVCSKSGIGEIITSGSAAGIWSWLYGDKSIEGIQVKCVGRGDERCKLIVSKPKVFEKNNYSFKKCTELIDIDMDNFYIEYNKPRKEEYSEYSLEEIIEVGIIYFKDNELLFKEKRISELDIHYVYYLEHFYDNILLYEVTKKFYKKIGDIIGEQLNEQYISNLMGALGWGDICMDDLTRILINNYPYTALHNKSSFPLIRGIMAGLISSLLKKDVNYVKTEKLIDNTFNIIIHTP